MPNGEIPKDKIADFWREEIRRNIDNPKLPGSTLGKIALCTVRLMYIL